jgi:hypothetical protein
MFADRLTAEIATACRADLIPAADAARLAQHARRVRSTGRLVTGHRHAFSAPGCGRRPNRTYLGALHDHHRHR